jgi:hypothetical protein
MKLFKTLVLLIVVGVFTLSSCKRKITTETDYPIYIYKEILADGYSNFEIHIAQSISINSSLGIEKQLQIIADTLSAIAFNGLQMEVAQIESISDREVIAEINLIEHPAYTHPGSVEPYQSWYDFFQGSAGGSFTENTLKANFLHRKINDTTVVAIKFSYNGRTDAQFDHIQIFNTIVK